ncbi:MAG TPA: tetratricopeptide repeat protein, partial [Chitinophagales bacterium]|nr:tetratricopeptide repeat protein [Chitinophagales bacterium]
MQVKSNTIKQELSKKSFEVIYKKSLAYKQKNELVKAIESYSKLIERIQHRENCVDCAKVYVDVGDIYFEINDFQHAFEYLEKASQIYAFNHLHELQLLQYKKIGGLQQNIWQFKKAIDIFHQGLSLATRLNNVERIIEFELLIGNALNWDDQLIASEQYLQSAINKEKKHPIPLI